MTEILNRYTLLLLEFDIKAISITIFLIGLILLIVYNIYKAAAHVKAAKKEYEILQRRGLLDEQSYTTALDKDIVGEEVVQAVIKRNPDLKPVREKEKVEKILPGKPGNTGNLVVNPKITNIRDTETTLLDMPNAEDPGTRTTLLDEEEQETAENYKTTLL